MQAMDSDDLSLYSSNENVLKPTVVEGIFGSTLKAGVAKDRYGGNDDSDEEELMTEDLEVVCDFDEPTPTLRVQLSDQPEVAVVESGYASG